MKIYVDNSVVGRLVDIERGIQRPSVRLREDMKVLAALMGDCRRRGIELCTSRDSLAEVERMGAVMPQVHSLLLAQISMLKLLPRGKGADALARDVERYLLEKTRVARVEKRRAVRQDSRHLAVCRTARCDFFLTTDYASIWAHRRGLKRLFGIQVVRPVELCRAIDACIVHNTSVEGDIWMQSSTRPGWY
jgi:hypothetical protein